MKENQTGGVSINFEYVDKMYKILKDDLSVKPHTTIYTISVNKKRMYDNLLDMNNNVKTVKKKKVSNDKMKLLNKKLKKKENGIKKKKNGRKK